MALRIEKLVTGCRGLAEINGKAAFIYNALPGEIVEPINIKDKKRYIEADGDVISPSPLRREPICPYYGQCGGCDFQITDERSSAMLKEEIVKDNLLRIGKVSSLPEFLPPLFGKADSYRHRARVHVNLKTREQGFLKRGSNELVAIKNCPLLDERLNSLLEERGGRLYKVARSLMFEGKVNRATGLVEVPLFAGDEEVSVGGGNVSLTVGSIPYVVSAAVFFQSNLELLPFLFDFIKKEAIGETIMDLYSGVGTFSAIFEGSGKKVYAVERQRECRALSLLNAPSAESFSDDVKLWARRTKAAPSTVIVDPPRVGLEREAISLISSWKPERIIYVSCDSATAARDIPLFRGYRAVRAMVMDFYPGSGHEESVFVLDKDF